ncbi:hypothetical protein PIB30_073641 [Stylosanthes scabra]|uniref:Uncharacterized protein n=1 Tax=Stylosanthes scabra TaxID=79078 RepID=A0ABU6RPB9_9FABA|nr:hypothetical protein [Stylosanthes scabra]
MDGSTSGYAARAADIAAAVKCEETTAARTGSTETPDTAGNGQGEAAEGGSTCKPHHRWGGKPHNRVGSDPSSAPRTRTTRCDPDPNLEPPPYSMNRARSTSVPKKKSRSVSCVTGPSPPGSWSPPPPECPPVECTPPPRPHRPRPTADPPAHCWMPPHPSAEYRALHPRLGHRAEAQSDLSPETQLGAHHPATEIPWDLAAGDPGSGTAGDRQPPTSQCTPYWANLGAGWARPESDDLGTSGCAKNRTSMQAHRATICRRPWPWRRGIHPGLQGPWGRAAWVSSVEPVDIPIAFELLLALARHVARPLSSGVRFSIDSRSISPNRSISNQIITKSNRPISIQKKSCMCSPTSHPGSFRCSLHKNVSANGGGNHHHGGGNHHLNMRRSAMKNSLVRIGGVEGEWVKRALTALIRPSSHQQRRRAGFEPRPSRLSVMSKAEDI